MESAAEEELSVEELASRHGVSPDRLERSFRAELGETPGRYWRKLRLRRARDLLVHSRMPVQEVALACGYADASSFARAFRAAFGASPNAFRRA
jgi:transcriptional regulator GlxA family with amidase domain